MSNSVQPNYKSLLIQKSVYLFFGKAVPVIILFVIAILFSRRLTYEDYGKFQSVWLYTNIINVTISFGITSVLLSSNLSFLTAFIKRHSKKIAGYYVTLCVAVLAVFLLYAKNFNASTKYLVILLIIIQNISTVSETLLLKYHKEKFVLGVNLIYSALFFSWHYFILTTGFSLDNLLGGIIILALLKLLVMAFIKGREETLVEMSTDKNFSRHWIYLGLNDITAVLSKWIDKLLLLYLLTPGDFAVFFNGSFEIPLFGLLVTVVGSVMLIELSKAISAKEKVQHLFTESFRILSIIVFPLFLFLLFFRNELFAIVFRHKYDVSLPIFLISIFILPVRINNYSSILQYYQKGNKIMTGSILDIAIAVILMICLYPFFGTKGIALAIVIATYCQALYYLRESAKILNTGILSLIPLKALSVIFLILLALFTGLYFGLATANDAVKLITGIASTIIIILIGLYLYFSKKSSTIHGVNRKI